MYMYILLVQMKYKYINLHNNTCIEKIVLTKWQHPGSAWVFQPLVKRTFEWIYKHEFWLVFRSFTFNDWLMVLDAEVCFWCLTQRIASCLSNKSFCWQRIGRISDWRSLDALFSDVVLHINWMETTCSMTCGRNILSPFTGLTTVGHNSIEMTPNLQLALCPMITVLSCPLKVLIQEPFGFTRQRGG